MRAWTLILGGLTVWAAHFFTLYGIASILPGKPLAPILALVATVFFLLLNLALFAAARRLRPSGKDEFRKWVLGFAELASLLSMLAVAWQGFPAVVGLF